MSEPLERLSRFTPDAGGLDRDGLLYAAGRASARPNRGWITLAAGLALTQTLTLVLLWPRPALPTAQLPLPPAPDESYSPDEPESPGLLSVRDGLLGTDPERRPEAPRAGTFVEPEPPLRAFAPSPAMLY
jgi:hypothetical protein